MGNSKYKLILASQSPRRKELLSFLKLPFKTIPALCEEVSVEKKPIKYVEDLARLKADNVFKRLGDKQNLVVGSDTIVSFNEEILEKPKTIEEAKMMLLKLSGKKHWVYTAVCIKTEGFSTTFYEETKVSFEQIDSYLLNQYIKSKDSMDKAGAYGIQGMALSFIKEIEGSYSNVMGFPINTFVLKLKEVLGNDWSEKFEV